MKNSGHKASTLRFYKEQMLHALVHIHEHLDEDLVLDDLAKRACLSPHHFHRVFRGMLGEPLATAVEAPGGGRYWDATAAHPRVPRSQVVDLTGGDHDRPSLEELIAGPTADPSGERNLFGSLRRVVGKCGYKSLKEFQRVELIITRGR